MNNHYGYEGERCRKCGIRPVDKSKSKYSILCTSCREEQIRYPIPKALLFAIVVVLVLVVSASVIKLPSVIKKYKEYEKSDNDISSFNDAEGENSDDEIVSEEAIKLLSSAMRKGQYESALNIYNKYIADKRVDVNDYTIIKIYRVKLNAYVKSVEAYYNIESKVDPNISEDELSEIIQKKLSAYIGNKSYDDATLYYLLGLCTKDSKKANEYFRKSIECDKNYQPSYVQLAINMRRKGEIKESKVILNNVLSVDPQNSGALRALAIISMLENDMGNAVKLAKKAYNYNLNEYYVYETLIIALYKNGQSEEAQKYIDEYTKKGNKLEEDTNKLLNGEITLEDYYIDK